MKILVVDDEPAVLALVARILEMGKHEVVRAATAGEALKLCEEPDSRFDLVITDIHMPGMNGRDLAKCIGKFETPIPLIFISGLSPKSPDVCRLVVDGRLDKHLFLQKPFLPAQLLATVAQALESQAWGLQNAVDPRRSGEKTIGLELKQFLEKGRK